MKLKMLTGLCGPKISLTRGDEHEFEDEEAIRMVRAGHATTTSEKDEKAVRDAIAKIEKAEAAAAKKAAKAAQSEDEPEEG